MTIDTQKLATDPEYWDSVAPEGATHYSPLVERFVKECRSCYMAHITEGRHGEWIVIESPQSHQYIPRPTKPETEWKGGLPPTGCECELTHPVRASFEDREVIADVPEGTKVKINGRADFGHGEVCIFSGTTDGAWFTGYHKELAFRPARTKQQRQRDELAEAVEAGMKKCGFVPSLSDCQIVAVEILSRHNQNHELPHLQPPHGLLLRL